MKRLPALASILAVLLLLTAGCDTESTTEIPKDVQSPTVAFISPVSGDSIPDGEILVILDASDNDRVVEVRLFHDDLVNPLAVMTSEPWQTTLGENEFSNGDHLLAAVAVDASGNVSEPVLCAVTKGGSSTDNVLRMSLVEIVTSANCAPCGPQNEEYHLANTTHLFEQRVATIKYHVWWPRPTDMLWQQSAEWSRPRVEYNFSPIPPAQFGAPKGWVGGEMISNKASDWISAANADLAKPAGAKIELSRTMTGNVIDLTIKLTGMTSDQFNDLRLHTVLTESEIEYNDGNSENIHYEVMRQMYPDAEGEAISLDKRQTKTFTRTIEIAENWNREHLQVVVFIQSKGSKEVLQAAKLDI